MLEGNFIYPSDGPTNLNGKDELPLWTKFELKRKGSPIGSTAGFIMDHYLVVVVPTNLNLRKLGPRDDNSCDSDSDDKNDPNCRISVLAFNLLDHSVHETEVEAGPSDDLQDFFLQYGENKIIKYRGKAAAFSLACITIESFQRKILISKPSF